MGLNSFSFFSRSDLFLTRCFFEPRTQLPIELSSVESQPVAQQGPRLLMPARRDLFAVVETLVVCVQIFDAAPQATVLAILSTVAKRLSASMQSLSSGAESEFRPGEHRALWQAHASRLMQLLPGPVHPAVVQTFCLSPSDARCCELQLSVNCKALGDAGGQAAGPPCPCNTPALQFLAATVPLAARVADIHADPARAGVGADPTIDAYCSMWGSGGRPSHAEHACAWLLPGGALTSLRLEMNLRSPSPAAAPLWWNALGLMRALRAVSIVIGVKRDTAATDVSAAQLAAALRSLPDLQALELQRAPKPRETGVCDADGRGEDMLEPEDACFRNHDHVYLLHDGAMLELVDGISNMTQLESLSLNAILKFPEPAIASEVPGPHGAAPVDVIGQLSRLSRLTYLSFSQCGQKRAVGMDGRACGCRRAAPFTAGASCGAGHDRRCELVDAISCVRSAAGVTYHGARLAGVEMPRLRCHPGERPDPADARHLGCAAA